MLSNTSDKKRPLLSISENKLSVAFHNISIYRVYRLIQTDILGDLEKDSSKITDRAYMY